jgi:hypothetical protein
MAKFVKPRIKSVVRFKSLGEEREEVFERDAGNHTDYLGTEIIRRRCEDLTLRQIKGQETAAAPTCNEG